MHAADCCPDELAQPIQNYDFTYAYLGICSLPGMCMEGGLAGWGGTFRLSLGGPEGGTSLLVTPIDSSFEIGTIRSFLAT